MLATSERFALHYDGATQRRLIAGREVIVHGHHYHCRLQHTVESAAGIDGKRLLREVAEAVFAEHVAAALRADDALATRWAVAAALYAHLGYGALDVSALERGRIEAASSHAVAGWTAGLPDRREPVCTLTEGYLAGAHRAVTGTSVAYRETACRVSGAPRCVFERDDRPRAEIPAVDRAPIAAAAPGPVGGPDPVVSPVVASVVAMPIRGDAEGLIPAFGVYLASTPADFYNLVCIRFVEAMERKGLARTAQRLLVADAEIGATSTFRGILGSPPWAELVAPTPRAPEDTLAGLVAVSTALGWGHGVVTQHTPAETLRLASRHGYEAHGYLALRGAATSPQCFLLRGVAAGMMAVVYGAGTIADRFGAYASSEEACVSARADACQFEVLRA